MGKFSKIAQDAFEEMQLDAGMFLNAFDPTSTADIADSAIVCATTGGIQISCVPSFIDFGEDVDNCPNNTKELKMIEGWECTVSTTALGMSPESIKLALGAADIDSLDDTKIIPRQKLKDSDFADLWWVGDRVDGGMVAVKIKNALSTGGFSLQTTKNGKGQLGMTLTGHISISDTSDIPMEFYSVEGTTGGTTGGV